MAELTLKPIGFFKGERNNKSALPRQGNLNSQQGFIQFEKGFDYKSAIKGLDQMSHLWVIFHFHKAQSEPKPLVRPPRSPDIQVGVFATRSPYRPNSLGLTLAKIEKVEGSKIYLSSVDLLDETPIFDLKPYVTESDFAKKPRLGWIDQIEVWKYSFAKKALKQIEWLKNNGLPEILDVCESQFGTPPLQPKRKRVKKSGDHYILSYRTWRFLFKLDQKKHSSRILSIDSGYSKDELISLDDPYADKQIHKKFVESF